MSNPNFQDINVRKKIIADIKGSENLERKKKALKAYDVFNDNAKPYVVNELVNQMSKKTVKNMPIVSDINFAKAIVNKQANIYTDEPERQYEGITEKEIAAIEDLYKDCGYNTTLGRSNKYYKLCNQSFLQVVPKHQKLTLRVLHGHNIDVIPDIDDPEKAYAYIISSFDKSNMYELGDGANQTIADTNDYKAALERYQVWTDEAVFTMNGAGALVSEYLENPIKTLPFIDIAKEKDFQFYVSTGYALTEFSIYLNTLWSDLFYIQRMQGHAIPVITGDPNLKPDSLTLSPSEALFLPTNANNPDSKLTIEFVSPNPNIEANIKSIDAATVTFLSTLGIDAKVLSVNSSGANSYSSALERLLAMIDHFRASKDDFDLFATVEQKLHEIVTKYLSVLSRTKELDKKYWTGSSVDKSSLSVSFKEPQMVETTSEKLTNAKSRIELGISDKVTVMSEVDNLSIEEAEKRISEIDERRATRIKLVQDSQVPLESDADADPENEA